MMKKTGKYSLTVSKETRENERFIDMVCTKIGDRKKSFYVVAITLSILVLCTTVFALTFWQLTSSNTQVEKNGNFSTTATSYEPKTESSKMTITSRASLVWQLTSRNIQVEKNSNFSTTATSYEPKTESSKMTITSYTLNVKKQLDEIACSQIIVSSNLAMHEQFSKLFGAYERLGLKNGRMMYINWKTNSRLFYGNYIYHNNYYDNHTETKEYRTKWMVIFEHYNVFDINCNGIVPTNSNCSPEWRFCHTYRFDRFFIELKLECAIIEHIKFECKNDSMKIKPIEDNQEECQELKFSSNDGIAKTVPEIMGIYSLQDYLFNDMVVYVHKKMGFNLTFVGSHSGTTNPTLQNQLPSGAWEIRKSTHILSKNLYCDDADLSMDGKCEFGWTHPINDQGNYKLDWSASIICIKPSPVVTKVPTGVNCRTFQLMSSTAMDVENIAYKLGEYVITESTNNGMVVYLNRDTSYFFYWVESTFVEGLKYWAIGSELGSETKSFFNPYCSNLDNPANGNCKYGWFYHNLESRAWKYDINMRIQCTSFVANSIT